MTRQTINSQAQVSGILLCANLLVKNGEEYFVMRRSSKKKFAPGYIVPFGGKLNPGENPLKGAVRELFEESGLVAKNIKLSAMVTEIHESPQMLGNWLTYYFIGDYGSGEVIDTVEGEFLRLTASELENEKLFPSFKKILPFMLKSERPIIALCKYDKNRQLVDSEIIDC